LHDFPAEATTNVSQQPLIVKPKYYFTCLYIDGCPTPLTVRLIENFNFTHPTPQVLGGRCDPTQMGRQEGGPLRD